MENEAISNRILIADDDPASKQVMGKALKRAGFEVALAEDGAECLHLYKKFSPNLVLIDFMMPLLDGLEVLAKIRSKHSRSALPVLMITSRGKSALIEQAVSKGVNDFLTKPIKAIELVDRVSRHFRRVDEGMLREILTTLHVPDSSTLSHASQAKLKKEGLVAYPVTWNGMKICVTFEIGKSPQMLSKAPLKELRQGVSVVGKPGFIWNNLWPLQGKQEAGAVDSRRILNEDQDWLKHAG